MLEYLLLVIIFALFIAYVYVCFNYFVVGLIISAAIACALLPWLLQKEITCKDDYLNQWASYALVYFMCIVLAISAVMNYSCSCYKKIVST